MTDIVFQGSEGQPLTNSVLVAEKFDKRHCDIIKKIKGLLNDSPQKCGQFFVSSTYTDSSGKENLMYIMNRDGFTLLAMGEIRGSSTITLAGGNSSISRCLFSSSCIRLICAAIVCVASTNCFNMEVSTDEGRERVFRMVCSILLKASI